MISTGTAFIRMPAGFEEILMSKGMNQKKNEKKKPAKTLLEKRAAKAEKKQSRSSSIGQLDRLR